MLTQFARKLSLIALAIIAFAGGRLATAGADQNYSVDYRIEKWKSLHLHDAKKADVYFKTLKLLGCEVKKESHGNHYDLTYRCRKWRRITVPNHDVAHRWQKWLRSSGFETKHQH